MLKRILLFDVNRILRFDINRILRWEISRAVIPTVLLKAFLGLVAAGFVLAIAVPVAARNGWPINEWMPLLVIAGCVVLAIADDLYRTVRRTR